MSRLLTRPSAIRLLTRMQHERVLLSVGLVGALAASALAIPPLQRGPADPAAGVGRVEKLGNDGVDAVGVARAVTTQQAFELPKPVWPGAGTTQQTLGASAGTAARTAATSAVTVRRSAKSADSRLTDVSVEVLGRDVMPARWRDGVVTRLAAPAGKPGGTGALSVDYSGFRWAYGAEWAERLQLWQLPECALSTPERRECTAKPLPSHNDHQALTVSADVAVPAASNRTATSGTLVALAGAPKSDSGDFTATPLSSSASWSVGGSTGGFTWSYPMRAPEAMGGPKPGLGISYNSDSVDGRSAATNNQPSWIGEGFNLAAGYIERTYVPCAEDKDGSPNNPKLTGDLCWRSDNAFMSLNGSTTELIYEEGKGWHARSEDGAVIKKRTGAGNGDVNGEYWEVTTTDGNTYHFGLDDLPGQSSATNSTWTVPVYGNHDDEPGHAEKFSDSSEVQAWRWNLDYVVDPRGNTMSYWYDKETNQYAAEATESKNVSYVRGGTLARIDYGTWDRSATDRSVKPQAQVVFDRGDRCLSDCGTHGGNWPDTPWDQECKASATECDDFSPTFWSTRRLAGVTTRVWDTRKEPDDWQNVDSYTLTPSFPKPGDGTKAGLWLQAITHTGHVTDPDGDGVADGAAISLPAIRFVGEAKANRVLTEHNTTSNWQRLVNIHSETGAMTQVVYSSPECTEANTKNLAPQDNTKLCYPVKGPDPSDPDGADITEWWHKYVVRQIAQSDIQLTNGGISPVVNTYYAYEGTPAWHYADDDGLTKPKRKTWDQFRGYKTVSVQVGDYDKTLTKTTYLRGMHGDKAAPEGGTKTVTVGASIGGEAVYDEDEFAGMVREQVVYNGTEDKPVSKTVNVPWRSDARATRTINKDVVTARFVNTAKTYQATALGINGSRGWRTTSSQNDFDDTYGTIKSAQNNGDAAKTGDETCTTYAYNRNADKNIVTLPHRTTTTTLTCGKTPTKPEDVKTDLLTYYDGATSATATPPKYGEVTRTDALSDWTTTGGTTWHKIEEATYDEFGRRKSTTDIKGKISRVTYTPATGLPTQRTEQNQLEWKTVTDLNPYWGTPFRVTDTNSRVTDVTYDALGRVSKVWEVGWPKAAHKDTPSAKYTYFYSPDGSQYPYLRTDAVNAGGGVSTSYQIFDGNLRLRQTQKPAVGPGRVITDTFYDPWGRMRLTNDPHAEEGEPSGTLLNKPVWSVPSQNVTLYDRANRPYKVIYQNGDGEENVEEAWHTETIHEGDRTTVIPPNGGTPTTTLTDIQGRTVELRQYTTDAGVNGAFKATKYHYNAKDQLVRVVDPTENEWTYEYDLRGRQKKATDPDKGTTKSFYNAHNELESTTDARGEVLVYGYDDLGRKTAVYDDVKSDATKRAEWKYDKLYTGVAIRGQLTEAIRYDNGNAYKWQVRNYNARYQPLGEHYVIPAAETGLAGTYLFQHEYNETTGTEKSVTYPAAGGLPSEGVETTFDAENGLPRTLKTGNTDALMYVSNQLYSAYGEPTITTRETQQGVYVQEAVEYEAETRRVHRVDIKPESTNRTVSSRLYQWQEAGNLLSITDTPQEGAADTQCFTYDKLRRLTKAWTPKVELGCGATASVANMGGPAPYLLDWTIDDIGNRTREESRDAGGLTVRDYTVPKPGPGVVRPHAVTSVTTTLPGQTKGTTTGYDYDAAGNMTSRPGVTAQQILIWDAEGKPGQITEGANKNTHVYTPDGGRLIRRDNTGTTLYLPGMEVRRPATGDTTPSATRYYTFAGKTIASRTPGAGNLRWIFSDLQGTQQVTIDPNTQKATTRRQKPYGDARGQHTPWPSLKGFVGGDIDPTGLTHIGAREYDPVLGRFISVDPIQDLADPQQWNAYAYSNNNPTTFTDPTGLRFEGNIPGCAEGNGGQCGGAPTPTPPTPDDNDSDGGKGHGREGNDSCKNRCDGTMAVYGNKFILDSSIAADKQQRIFNAFWSRWVKLRRCYPNGVCEPEMPYALATTIKAACMDNGGCGNTIDKATDTAGILFAAKAQGMTEGGGEGPAGAGLAPVVGNPLKGRAPAPKRRCNSFSAETLVAMADGSRKRIEDVKAGDKVLATDPRRRVSRDQMVTATHVNRDKDFTDVTVSVGRKKAVLETTTHHQFWGDANGQWIEAGDLRPGDALESPGDNVKVEKVHSFSAKRVMYDLTVNEFHTYYVLAGDTPVLVHNCGGRIEVGDGAADDLVNFTPAGAEAEFVFDAGFKRLLTGDVSAEGLSGSPHQQLARSLGADEDTVLGGTIFRENGRLVFTENSGHYGHRWTGEMRQNFQSFLSDKGVDFEYRPWG